MKVLAWYIDLNDTQNKKKYQSMVVVKSSNGTKKCLKCRFLEYKEGQLKLVFEGNFCQLHLAHRTISCQHVTCKPCHKVIPLGPRCPNKKSDQIRHAWYHPITKPKARINTQNKVCGYYLIHFFMSSNFYQLDSHNKTCVAFNNGLTKNTSPLRPIYLMGLGFVSSV